MTDEADLIRAMVAAPGDRAPRLVFADYLDERGGNGHPLRRRGSFMVTDGFLWWHPAMRRGEESMDTLIGPVPGPPPCERADCRTPAMFHEAGHWFCLTCLGRVWGLRDDGRTRRPISPIQAGMEV